MTAKARIFTILQFTPNEVGRIANHVHYVAATCDQEAEDVFREEAGHLPSTSHYYVLTDDTMARAECGGSKTRCELFIENRRAPSMTQADYTRWILAFTRRLWDPETESYEEPTYRRIN